MVRVVIVGIIAAVAMSAFTHPRPFVARDVLRARALWRAGDAAGAHRIATAALTQVRRQAASVPGDPERQMALAEALALAGHPREAMSAARSALAADAAAAPRREGGPSLVEALAIVAMEAGATDEALDAIEILLARGPRAGRPRIAEDDRFAPLRTDPRFARLLALYGTPPAPML